MAVYSSSPRKTEGDWPFHCLFLCAAVAIKAWKTRGVWGHDPPRNLLDIRCSEIASEAILGRKQSHIAATWLTECCIHFLAVHICIHER